tara:strand:- start:33 stop:800 length:768 start_codon:yes stop_codon:yes gene_type:complete
MGLVNPKSTLRLMFVLRANDVNKLLKQLFDNGNNTDNNINIDLESSGGNNTSSKTQININKDKFLILTAEVEQSDFSTQDEVKDLSTLWSTSRWKKKTKKKKLRAEHHRLIVVSSDSSESDEEEEEEEEEEVEAKNEGEKVPIMIKDNNMTSSKMNSKNTNIIESNNNNIANNTTTSIANNVNTNKQNDEVANLLRSPPLMLRKQNNVQENKTPPSSPFLIGKKSSLDNIKGRNSPRLKPIVNPNNINNINSITT